MNGLIAGPPVTFNPMHVDKLYADTPDEYEWVLENCLPVGCLGVLAGYPKAGKSTFTYWLASRVVHGLSFLGQKVKKGNVLILAVEESRIRIKKRMKRFGVTEKDGFYVHQGPLPVTPHELAAIKVFIKAFGIVLVILDTIGHVWDVQDENSNAQVARALKPWLELARSTEAGVLLIHHSGKGGVGIRGASSFAGTVDELMTLEEGKGASRKLKSWGRDVEPMHVTMELVGDEYVLVSKEEGEDDESDAHETKLSADEKIVNYVLAHPGLDLKDVKNALGMAKQTFSDAKNKLIASGKLLKHSDDGGWFAVDSIKVDTDEL